MDWGISPQLTIAGVGKIIEGGGRGGGGVGPGRARVGGQFVYKYVWGDKIPLTPMLGA